MNDLIRAGQNLLDVRVGGLPSRYGGIFVDVEPGIRRRGIVIPIHGIAGDAGESAYFMQVARFFLRAGFATLFVRADGYIASGVSRRIVDQGSADSFVDVLDAAIARLGQFEPLTAALPIVLVPHSIAVAKTVVYSQSAKSRNRSRIHGVMAMSPVDVQRGFGKHRSACRAACILTQCGLGRAPIPPVVMRKFGGLDIDWGMTVRTLALLGRKGNPLDVVDPQSPKWMQALRRNLALDSSVCKVYVAENDRRYGKTSEDRRSQVESICKAAEHAGWPCAVVAGANHSFQAAGANRQDETALLFDAGELEQTCRRIADSVAARISR